MRLLAVLITTPGLLIADEHWIYAPMVDACFERSIEDGGPESCIGDAATACMDGDEGGHSTVGMMFCMLGERDAWDVLLNQEYQSARAFARGMDEQSQENFPEYAVRDEQVLAAQRAWIAFRDANCSMAYGLWGEGSMRQIAGSRCQMQMTAEQTLALRDYQDFMR